MKSDKALKWKVISSEYLSQRPWFTVRREHLELPNGNQVPEYYVLEYPEWVNTIAITKDNRFIFVHQYRHAMGYAAYELCAGVCDPEDSSPLEAAKRELIEETGYGNGQWSKIMTISANPATHTNMTHCFLAVDVEPVAAQNLEQTEDLTVHILTRQQVMELLESDRIKQALNAAPLWKYFAGQNK